MKKLIFLMGIFLLFLIPLNNPNNGFAKNSNINLESSVISNVYVSKIYYTYTKGDSWIDGSLYGSVEDTDFTGTEYFYVYGFHQPMSPNHAYTRLLTYGSFGYIQSYFRDITSYPLVYRNGQYWHNDFKDGLYIIPDTLWDNELDNYGLTLSYAWERYNARSQGTSSPSLNIPAYLFYHLEPTLLINSTYYNYDNIRLETYTGLGLSFSYDLTFGYMEQDPNNILLTYPQYYYRILDKETNQTIFQDTTYQWFNISRTIDLPSFKVQNNFDEMVNCTIKKSSNQALVYQSNINPYSNLITNITDDTYDLELFDMYSEKLFNQTFTFPTITNITYTPENYRECFISYSDQSGNYLDFNNYKVKVNDSIVYSPNIFKEIDKYVNITTYDVFDRELDQQLFFVDRQDNYFNITLEQYSLRIRNNQVYDSEIEIKLIPETTFKINTKLTSNDLIDFHLYPDTYNITYSNETFQNTSIDFDLNKASAITLNSTKKDFTISLFDESGFGVSLDNVRMYYDNVRTSGFLRTFDGIHNIKILDYFNTSLFDQNVDITPYTEFNVYLPIYTLIINNNYSQQMNMIIEREGISFAVVDQVIPALSSYQFRFAANLDYIISFIYLNSTFAESRSINLASNVQIESFGYYSLADITQIDNSFSGSEIGLIIAVIAGLAFISIQSLRKPKVYKTESPIPLPKKRDNNPRNRKR